MDSSGRFVSPMPIASAYASASRLFSSLLAIGISFLMSRWFAGKTAMLEVNVRGSTCP